jgi:hypothetical protein
LLEKHLFLAMLFAFAALYTRQTICNPDANFTQDYLALADDLARQSHLHLAHLFRGDAPFWPYHQAFWRETTETTADTPYGGTGRRSPTGPLLPPVPLKREYSPIPLLPYSISPLAFTKIPIAAVALSLGGEDDLPALVNLLDNFNSVYQTLLDISTLRRDLAQRRHTYPILRTMQAAELDPQQPHSAERILGALALTGVVEQLGQEGLATLADCRAQAEALNWPTFAAYLPVIEDWINHLRVLFNINKPTKSTAQKPISSGQPLFVPFGDT